MPETFDIIYFLYEFVVSMKHLKDLIVSRVFRHDILFHPKIAIRMFYLGNYVLANGYYSVTRLDRSLNDFTVPYKVVKKLLYRRNMPLLFRCLCHVRTKYRRHVAVSVGQFASRLRYVERRCLRKVQQWTNHSNVRNHRSQTLQSRIVAPIEKKKHTHNEEKQFNQSIP